VPDPNSGEVGQSGTQITRFIGGLQGTAEITLEYKRPWEKGKKSVDNYTVTIVSSGKYTGNYIPVKPQSTGKHKFSSTPKSLPSSFSWQSQCTPIKDQGQCGSCWAFAGCGTFEANIKIRDNVTRNLSEQWLVNCATDMYGCSGGNCPHHYWKSPGAVYETQEPYTAVDGTCQPSYMYHETIDSYADIDNGSPTDADIKQAIYDYGPVWVSVTVGNNFTYYSGGIFNTSEGDATTTNHAVVLVGWDDQNGYWILRNSWSASWGESGYMRIAYGISGVGSAANYIVYEGGIPHAVPPVADFAASTTTSCTGMIQFTDASANNPTQWLWNFGDGTTSIIKNPSHTYTSSGIYNVSLKATNGYGNNTKTKTSYITINLATSPTVTGASGTGPCSVTLSASGSGTLNWYDASTGGNLLHTGTSYTTPILSTTTTYYVQSTVTQSVQSAGMAANTANGSYFNTAGYGWALIFDALSTVTINSVTVYANSTASRCIWLKNSSGAMLDSVTTSIATGTQSVTLNFNIPAGTGYQLGADGTCNLWRESSGTSYPYTTAGLVSITGNTAGADRYYYFYNWQVHGASCVSQRVPVTATITTSGINESSISDFGIFPNPNTGTFEIKLNNLNFQNATVSMINMLGELLLEKNISNNTSVKFDASAFSQGIYYIKVKTENSTYIRKVIIAN
jgi:PKD repeat protein